MLRLLRIFLLVFQCKYLASLVWCDYFTLWKTSQGLLYVMFGRRLFKIIKIGPKPKARLMQQTGCYHCVRNWSWCRPLRPWCAWIPVGWHRSTLWRPWRMHRWWPPRPGQACIPESCEGGERITEQGAASEHSMWPFGRLQKVWNMETSGLDLPSDKKNNQTRLYVCLCIPLLLTKTTEISERRVGSGHTFLKTDRGVTRARTKPPASAHPGKPEIDSNQKTWHILCRNLLLARHSERWVGVGWTGRLRECLGGWGRHQAGLCCGHSYRLCVLIFRNYTWLNSDSRPQFLKLLIGWGRDVFVFFVCFFCFCLLF